MNRSWNQDFKIPMNSNHPHKHEIPRSEADPSESESFSAISNVQLTPAVRSPTQKKDGSPDSGYSGSNSHDLDAGRPETSSDNLSPISYRQSYESTDDWNMDSVTFPTTSESYNWTVYPPSAFNIPSQRRKMSETGSNDSSSSDSLLFLDMNINFDISSDSGPATPDIESRPIIKDAVRNFIYSYNIWPLNTTPGSFNNGFNTTIIHRSNPSNQFENYAEVKEMETDNCHGNFDINVVGRKERETDNYHGNFDTNVEGKERETDNCHGNFDVNVVGRKERETDNYYGDFDKVVERTERETDNYHGNFDKVVGGKKRGTDDYHGDFDTNVVKGIDGETDDNYFGNSDVKVTRKERETGNHGNFEPKVVGIRETGTKNSGDDLETLFQSCLLFTKKLKSDVESLKQMMFSTSEASRNLSKVEMESRNIEKNENGGLYETEYDNTDFDTGFDIFYKSFMKFSSEMQRQIKDVDKRIISHLNRNKDSTQFI